MNCDYILNRNMDDSAAVFARDIDDGGCTLLPMTGESYRRSPGGYDWGHSANGGFATAHSILADHLGREVPVQMAYAFRNDILNSFSRHGGVIRWERVHLWLDRRFPGATEQPTATALKGGLG